MSSVFLFAVTDQSSVQRLQSPAFLRRGKFIALLFSLHQLVAAQTRDAMGAAANPGSRSAPGAQTQPCPRPFLWQIDRSPPAFLFGTIHLANDQIQDLPPVVNAAIEVSQAVITEIPMDVPALLQEMGPRMLLPEGRSLSEILPPALYGRLEKYVSRRGQSMAAFEKNKVWVVTAQVGILELVQETGPRDGLDLLIARKAGTLKKETGGLETAKEQLDAFDELTLEDQIQSLDRLLSALERQDREGRRIAREMLDRYCEGDGKKLTQLMDEWLDPKDSAVARTYEMQITHRDQRFADRVDKYLKENPDQSCLFAVGAYHLIGSDRNVITLLQDKGWRIQRLSSNDTETLRAKTKLDPADTKHGIPKSKRVDQIQGGEK